jgi:hypothetical protein
MIYLLTAGLLVLIFWNPKDNLKQITTNQETQANLTKDSEQKRNKDENQRKENFFYNNALKISITDRQHGNESAHGCGRVHVIEYMMTIQRVE